MRYRLQSTSNRIEYYLSVISAAPIICRNSFSSRLSRPVSQCMTDSHSHFPGCVTLLYVNNQSFVTQLMAAVAMNFRQFLYFSINSRFCSPAVGSYSDKFVTIFQLSINSG
ncbi:hypothetical protein TNCT_565481 [Trichonephila clavata]|uniref:Uncharacterized protein n=1 Tax=Trichonephila clavata TaxID=2740835 RepID=A0A8X6J5W6_TRICU|nr:hypothetical protein TNCT_565481 [Trichonephila clavata]